MKSEQEIQTIAAAFVEALPNRYAVYNVLVWGLAFTTYEDELEAAHGEESLPAIKQAIDRCARQRWERGETR